MTADPADPWAHPDTKAWLKRTAKVLPEMIRSSAVSVSLVPEDPRDTDIKYAVELGLTIMLDKPILCVVKPGTRVPDHLIRVADLIIECDMANEADRVRLAFAISEFVQKYAKDDGDDVA